MQLKFPTLMCFLGIFVAGFFLIQYPHSLLSNAGQINHDSNEQKLINQIKHNDIIYLGEHHDSVEDHAAQLNIITQLHHLQTDSQGTLAIALEMFQHPFQPLLDRYLAGEISEAELRKQTEYDTRWGFDWKFYAPILRFAQTNQIPLIALNTPTEITFKVSKNGLNSLEGDELDYIPPLSDIELDNQAYRQKLQVIYQQHTNNRQVKGNSNNFDNFFAAQVLWEETMAEAIALYHQKQPQSQIVVLVGQGHIHDYGIPSRVAKRLSSSLQQDSVFLGANKN
ncbi:MAG: ChaN family lipoprotein [Waterburya sp.]